MKNYKFGYARVSTEEQVLDRQIDMLSEYGVNQIYSEKMTGTKRNRPELEKMLDRLSEGDTVVIESLSRLGRSTKDLIELMELFNKKKVNLVSFKENIEKDVSQIEALLKDEVSYKLMAQKAQNWSREYTLEKFETEIKKLLL